MKDIDETSVNPQTSNLWGNAYMSRKFIGPLNPQGDISKSTTYHYRVIKETLVMPVSPVLGRTPTLPKNSCPPSIVLRTRVNKSIVETIALR